MRCQTMSALTSQFRSQIISNLALADNRRRPPRISTERLIRRPMVSLPARQLHSERPDLPRGARSVRVAGLDTRTTAWEG
jgi:hypothetical protein